MASAGHVTTLDDRQAHAVVTPSKRRHSVVLRRRVSALKADRREADGVFISCTNLPTAPVIERLEAELGKPVVTSNQSTLWLGLRALGVTAAVPGAGRLLAGPYAPGADVLAQPGDRRA